MRSRQIGPIAVCECGTIDGEVGAVLSCVDELFEA